MKKKYKGKRKEGSCDSQSIWCDALNDNAPEASHIWTLSHLGVKLLRKDQEVQCVGGGVPLGGLEHFKSLGQTQSPLLPAASDRYKGLSYCSHQHTCLLPSVMISQLTLSDFKQVPSSMSLSYMSCLCPGVFFTTIEQWLKHKTARKDMGNGKQNGALCKSSVLLTKESFLQPQ